MFVRFFVFFTTLIVTTLIVVIFIYPKTDTLKIVVCDVGQGDGILLIYKNYQVIIDGGANSKIINCLGRYLPFWDRTIELVVLTHPQDDHYKGLINVFQSYNVQNFMLPPLDSSNEGFSVLKNIAGSEGSHITVAHDGYKVRVGLIYLDIVWPSMQFISGNSKYLTDKTNDNNFSKLMQSDLDPNSFSLVVLGKYKDFDMLFTGDIEPDAINIMLESDLLSDIEYLKVPHHGSKNGLSRALLERTTPEIGVISLGKDNRYGHPHEEVLDLLLKMNVKVYRTDIDGDVIVETDGRKFVVK